MCQTCAVRDRALSGCDPQAGSPLLLHRQQAALVANRKEKFAEELQGLKEAKAKVEEELATRDQEFRGFQGAARLHHANRPQPGERDVRVHGTPPLAPASGFSFWGEETGRGAPRLTLWACG